MHVQCPSYDLADKSHKPIGKLNTTIQLIYFTLKNYIVTYTRFTLSLLLSILYGFYHIKFHIHIRVWDFMSYKKSHDICNYTYTL